MEARDLRAGGSAPVNLRLPPGQLLLLTTTRTPDTGELLAALAGLQPLQQGSLWLHGQRVDGLPPDQRRRRGLVLVPAQPPVLPGLSVQDNLRVGGCHLPAAALSQAMQRSARWWPELQACRQQRAGTLSGGQRRLLALAQGLVASPRWLLLDEPTQALAPALAQRLVQRLGELRQHGLAVLVADAQALWWQPVADQVVVLDG